MNTQVSSRINYIRSLELADFSELDMPVKTATKKFAENEPGAFINAGSIEAADIVLPEPEMSDVLNSKLLAQLAANKAHDRYTATDSWYKKYCEVLENIGWVIDEFAFNRQSIYGDTVQLDTVAIGLFAAAVSGSQLGLLINVIKALKDNPDNDGALKIFDQNGSDGENGNFQIATTSLDPNRNVQMTLGAFKFTASESTTHFLWWSWSSKNINIWGAIQQVTLNEQIYSTVREEIIKKLGDKAKQYVKNIEI